MELERSGRTMMATDADVSTCSSFGAMAVLNVFAQACRKNADRKAVSARASPLRIWQPGSIVP